jgi:hypothetical protein
MMPATPTIRPTPRAAQRSAPGSPMKLRAHSTRCATDRPTTPPQPAGSASTDASETNASADAISATPIAALRSIATQRPGG